MKGEQLVSMAAKLYKCRRAAKTLFGDEYAAKIEPYKKMIRGEMPKHNNDELSTAVSMAHEIKDMDDNGVISMLILAAAVEIIEPENL